MSSLLKRLFCIVWIFILTGCGLQANRAGPTQTAKNWLKAVLEQDALTADELTCEAQREQLNQDMAIFSGVGSLGQLLFGVSLDLEYDISDIEFTVTSNESGQALVHVSGEMRLAAGGTVERQQVDEGWLIVEEDGDWKWCGVTVSPDLAITEPPQREDVVEVLRSVEGFRSEGNSWLWDEDGDLTYSATGTTEWMMPNRRHRLQENSRFGRQEVIEVEGIYCYKDADEPWDCVDRPPFELRDIWISIVMGETDSADRNIRYSGGLESETERGQPCYTYYKDEVDAQSSMNLWHYELCIDYQTLLPVYWKVEASSVGAPSTEEALIQEAYYYDFGETFQIELPAQ